MAKQLFNSSEKSNFILNMTEEKYSKLASWCLVLTFILTSLTASIPLITGEKIYVVTTAGLTVGGVFSIVLAIIGAMKKYISKKVLFPVCTIGIMLIWAVISMINGYDSYVSLNGFPGRGEGVLAILFYVSFFLTALSIKTDKSRKFIFGGILANGLINSVFALIQIFTGELSDYKFVSMKIKVHAASGLSQSPLFLAVVLSISIAVAIIGLAIFESKKAKVVSVISACVFSFVIMFTYSFIGICGLILALIIGFIVIIATKSPKKNLLSGLCVVIPAVLAVVIVQCGLIGNIDSYRLYDGRILWFADSHMRLNAGGNFDDEIVDIDDTYDVYYTLNRKAMNIASACPLTGTGPDQLVYPQIYTFGAENPETAVIEDIAILNKGTFDRVYNEYLNVSATRGIPSAIALGVTILGVLVIGFKGYKKSKNAITLATTLITAMVAVLYVICCSSTAFTPIFWVIAGSAVGDVKKSEK